VIFSVSQISNFKFEILPPSLPHVPHSHLYRRKSNQNCTVTFDPEYPDGNGPSGLDPIIARSAELSTEAFPLDCINCAFTIVPSRRISNVYTTRGAQRTEGSTVDCSQLLLTRARTPST
jgi:hypothetical protein